MSKYLAASLPPPPAATTWLKQVASPYGVMGNDRYGDCTAAAVGHAIQTWTANAGKEQTPTDAQVLGLYSATTNPSFDPTTGANDNGAVVTDVLNGYRANGFAGTQLQAYLAIDPKSQQELQYASALFGGAYLGVELPQMAMMQTDQGQPWSVPNGHIPWFQHRKWHIIGGHAVFAPDYQAAGVIAITWGQQQPITWSWIYHFCQEAYALLSPAWISQLTHLAPNGIDLVALAADLQAITAPAGN